MTTRKTLTLPTRTAPLKAAPAPSAPRARKPGAPGPKAGAGAKSPARSPRPPAGARSSERPTGRRAPSGNEGLPGQSRAARPRPAPAAPSGERLSKRVMQLKGCSRSEAEQYITSGFVAVQGRVVEEPGYRVDAAAHVTLSPDASLLAPLEVSFVLHKPPQWLDGVHGDTPSRPPAGGRRPAAAPNARTLLVAEKQWVQDPTQQAFLQRFTKQLDACVPLETGASGLVVFTQDWRVTRKLEEHLGEMEHEYMVDIAQAVSPEQLQAITRVLKDPRENLPFAKASISSNTPNSTRLRFAVKGAHPGLIAYVLGKVGLPIAALQRTRLGRVALGQLPVGQWRYLAGYEKF